MLKSMRLSLAFVWLVTAWVSAVEWRGQSADLLKATGVTDALWIDILVWGGVALDALLGLALGLTASTCIYWLALISMVVMTIAASLMLPSLWLHPLGPLLKNIPIAIMLWTLIQAPKEAACQAT